DFNLIRTYNSRDKTHPGNWTFSFNVSMRRHDDELLTTPNPPGPNPPGNAPSTKVHDYSVFYGDASESDFVYNSARGLWISTDGAGAYETLVVAANNKDLVQYTVTRANRSVYRFDKDF